MVHFVGLDVSVKATSVCVVDDADAVILQQKVPTEAADIVALLTSLGVTFGRIGIEAGPLSQWLVNALTEVDLPVICVETRHMKALLTAQQISKTDRNDARGLSRPDGGGSRAGRAPQRRRAVLQRTDTDHGVQIFGHRVSSGQRVHGGAANGSRCGIGMIRMAARIIQIG
jgi:transposase